MYRNYVVTATAAGTVAGSAVGTAYSNGVVAGVIRAVHFDYSGTALTTDVTLTTMHNAQSIIAVSDSVTDAWYYPSIVLNDGTAGARAAFDGVPVVDHLKLTIGQSIADEAVTATVIVQDS